MQLDKEILRLLGEDARYTADKIAVMLGVEASVVADAIKEMENKGIIVKYATIVNENKLPEESVSALIEVKVTPQRRSGYDAIAREIMRFSEVKAVYLMSGAYDLSIRVEAGSMRGVSMFISEKLSTIEAIVGVATHFIMKKYKDGGVSFDTDTDKRTELF